MSITNRPTSNRRWRTRIGLAVVASVLISAAACSSSEGASPTSDTPVSTPITTATPTTQAARTTPTTPTALAAPAEPIGATLPAADAVRPSVTIDELAGIDGQRVHIRCAGTGAATVLLIAGFESSSDSWAMVEPVISEQARVCVYDRPGTGTSDPATGTGTFASQSTDLHDLLASIGEPGPYVVVGHSFGGAQAVTFASMFTDEVAGLVLVDASPGTWPDALCAVADDDSEAATMIRGLCAGWSDPNANVEHLDVFTAFAGASAIASLGSLPMTVITAVDRQVPAGLAADELARLTDIWNRGQQRWSRLSAVGRVVSVEDASHFIQLDHPDVVTDEIARLLP